MANLNKKHPSTEVTLNNGLQIILVFDDPFPACPIGNQQMMIDAYYLSVQGFFIKQTSQAESEKTITSIMEYLKRYAAPSNF